MATRATAVPANSPPSSNAARRCRTVSATSSATSDTARPATTADPVSGCAVATSSGYNGKKAARAGSV